MPNYTPHLPGVKNYDQLDEIWDEARQASANANEAIGYLKNMLRHNEIDEVQCQDVIQRLESVVTSLRHIAGIA